MENNIKVGDEVTCSYGLSEVLKIRTNETGDKVVAVMFLEGEDMHKIRWMKLKNIRPKHKLRDVLADALSSNNEITYEKDADRLLADPRFKITLQE